jgi:hypothetical protein
MTYISPKQNPIYAYYYGHIQKIIQSAVMNIKLLRLVSVRAVMWLKKSKKERKKERN